MHRTVEAVWRMESAKVTATLARFVRDVGLAEELAQDTLVAALEQWPADGVPRNPGAWLTTIGKRRAVDHIRRQETLGRKVAELGRDLEARVGGEGYEEDFDAALDDAAIEDDVLRLVFTACHPVLSTEARVALTLRMIGGLSTPEIARAFLVSESRRHSGSSGRRRRWPKPGRRSRPRRARSARSGSRTSSKSST